MQHAEVCVLMFLIVWLLSSSQADNITMDLYRKKSSGIQSYSLEQN